MIIGIRILRVKGFICPHQRHKISFPYILDVVRIARRNIYHLRLFTGYNIFCDSVTVGLSQLDQGISADYQEFFRLGMMPVIAFGDARLCNIDRKLTAVRGADKLSKRAAFIGISLQRIAEMLLRKIGEIGAVKLFFPAAVSSRAPPA